jgi:hypothetical protein
MRRTAVMHHLTLSLSVRVRRANAFLALPRGAKFISERAPDEYLTAISARVIWQEMGFVTFAISVKDGHFLLCATRRAISISSLSLSAAASMCACECRLGGLILRRPPAGALCGNPGGLQGLNSLS